VSGASPVHCKALPRPNHGPLRAGRVKGGARAGAVRSLRAAYDGPGHWRAIRGGQQRSQTASRDQPAAQVTPVTTGRQADSQAENAGSIPVIRSNHGGPGHAVAPPNLGLRLPMIVTGAGTVSNQATGPGRRLGRPRLLTVVAPRGRSARLLVALGRSAIGLSVSPVAH
jgi:hypothetical protein